MAMRATERGRWTREQCQLVMAALPFGGSYLDEEQRRQLYDRFYKRRVKQDMLAGQRGPRTQHASWADFMRHKRARMYGLDGGKHLAELEQTQGGVCAICLSPESRTYRGEKVSTLDIDHDHSTGEIRGLLCSSCNRMLANAKDDPAKLRAAALYLEKFDN